MTYIGRGNNRSGRSLNSLTVGKPYSIVDENDVAVKIMNDKGIVKFYCKDYFKQHEAMQSKLPEIITKQIDSEAKKAATIAEWGEYDSGPASSARMAQTSRIDPIQKEFYIKGATEWAQWKVKYDELKKEADQLRRWKMKAVELLTKINSYAHKHLEIKLGQCAVDLVISMAKERDELKERCEKMEAALEWIKTYGPDQSAIGQAFIAKALAYGINEKEGARLLNPAEEDSAPQGMPLPAEDPFKNTYRQ